MRNRLLHAGCCLAFAAGLANVAHADQPIREPSAARMSPLVKIIQRACESTVDIHTERREKRNLDAVFGVGKGGNKINGMGTGLIIDERGYILTNNHVVQDVESIRVVRHNGESFTATVFQTDAVNDLALIRIQPAGPLPVIPMGTSSDLMLGEGVVAIGNSFGYEHSVTQGIVSSLHRRDIDAGENQTYADLIQTDAAINPGNSGGPLLNMDGEVIGINVAIRAGANKIGFAIPIDAARAAVARMLSVERTGSLYHGAITRDHKAGSLRELLIQAVKPNSPAATAGLQPGDVVLKVGGTAVVDSADFERALLDRRANETLPLVVIRSGKEESLDLTLAGMRADAATPVRQTVVANMPTAAQPVSAKSERVWDSLGLRMTSLDKNDPRLSGLPYQGGMLVNDVRRDSIAFQNGVKRGDVLVGLHSYETVKENDVLYVLNQTDLKGTQLKFYIVRERETLFGHFSNVK
jgi:serine protease Do